MSTDQTTTGNGAFAALVQLTLTRLREFYRQPEAVFWVYFFPILMVVALGIAFRNKPIEIIKVDVQESPSAEALATALRSDERMQVSINTATTCSERLRTGKCDLYVFSEAILWAKRKYKQREDRGVDFCHFFPAYVGCTHVTLSRPTRG